MYRTDVPHIAMLQVKLGSNFESLTASEKYTLIAIFSLYKGETSSGSLVQLADEHAISLTEDARWVLEALDDSPNADVEDLMDFTVDFTAHILNGIHA